MDTDLRHDDWLTFDFGELRKAVDDCLVAPRQELARLHYSFSNVILGLVKRRHHNCSGIFIGDQRQFISCVNYLNHVLKLIHGLNQGCLINDEQTVVEVILDLAMGIIAKSKDFIFRRLHYCVLQAALDLNYFWDTHLGRSAGLLEVNWQRWWNLLELVFDELFSE